MREINYDRIRNAGDHVMPDPFPHHDQDGVPTNGVQHLALFSPGERIIDRRGERFRVLAHGPMQGTVVLRDRHQAMFYADVDQYFRKA